jgi:hypothetical protein
MSDGIRSGRELDAVGIEPEDGSERRHQLGLGEAGYADKQRMTTRTGPRAGLLDDAFLSENHLRDGRFDRGDVGERCSAAAITAFSSIGSALVSMRPMGISARSGSSLSNSLLQAERLTRAAR